MKPVKNMSRNCNKSVGMCVPFNKESSLFLDRDREDQRRQKKYVSGQKLT